MSEHLGTAKTNKGFTQGNVAKDCIIFDFVYDVVCLGGIRGYILE